MRERMIPRRHLVVAVAVLVAALSGLYVCAFHPATQAQAALPDPPFTLKASRIEAHNAHLALGGTLSFDDATIDGMSITSTEGGHTLTTTAGGRVTAGATRVKSSLGNFLAAARYITYPPNGAVALILGTVPDLVMEAQGSDDVTLVIDGSMTSQSLSIPGMQVSYK